MPPRLLCRIGLLILALILGWCPVALRAATAPITRDPARVTPRVPPAVTPTVTPAVRPDIPIARLPQTFILLPGRATLERCVGTTDDAKRFSGSGTFTLKLTAGGKAFQYTAPVTLRMVTVNDAKQVTGGSLVIGEGNWADFLQSDFDLRLANGSLALKQNPLRLEVSCHPVVTTPFKDAGGFPFAADYAMGSALLTVGNDGGVTFTATGAQNAKGMKFMSMKQQTENQGAFVAAGCGIIPETVNLQLSATEAAKPTCAITCPAGALATNIPNLLAVAAYDLPLRFTNLQLNNDGEVTAEQMSLRGPTDVALANPADFLLSVSKADVSMKNSAFTEFTLQAKLVLPDCVKADDNGRVELPLVTLDMLGDPVVDLSASRTGSGPARNVIIPKIQQSRYINFNGYRVALSDLVIDLSRKGPANLKLTPGITGVTWQGVYAREAAVTLPKADWSDAQGNPVTLDAKNCLVDANGFTGDVDAPADKLKDMEIHGFNANLKNLRIVFGRNSIVNSDCRGSTSIPRFTGKLDLIVKISNTGTSARVETPSTLKNPRLGVEVAVKSGVLQPDPNDNYALWVNGALSINIAECASLRGSALGFHQLGITDTGSFVTVDPAGWLTLDTPANADFEVFRCNLSSVGFRRVDGTPPGDPQYAQKARWTLALNGELSLNADVPVDGTLSYAALQVNEGDLQNPKPYLYYKDIGVNADVMGLIRITSVLNGSSAFGKVALRGDAKLSFTFLGQEVPITDLEDPDGPNAHLEFLVGGGNVWAVAGSVRSPQDIPLGNSGLGLYKFTGGLARNCTPPASGNFGGVDELTPAPNSDKWLFSAGCSIAALDDHNLFHADGNLTIGLPDFSFNMHGDAWVLTDDETPPGMLVVDVTCVPSVPSFAVNAAVDLEMPSADIVDIHGSLNLLLSPGDVHLDLGWPYPENAVSVDVLNGALSLKGGVHCTPGSYQVAAGTNWNYWVFKGSIYATYGYNFLSPPYLNGSIMASGCVDFWIASLGASARLSGALYDDRLDFSGEFTATVGMPWPVPDIDVSVDFSGSIP